MENEPHAPNDNYLDLLSKIFGQADEKRTPEISVRVFLKRVPDLEISVIAGAGGLSRKLSSPKIQKPGLAFAGFLDFFEPGRIQILGRAEIQFIRQMGLEALRESLEKVFPRGLTCMVISRAQKPPVLLKEFCEAHEVPLLSCPKIGAQLVEGLIPALERELSPQIKFQGNLIAAFGLGALVIGESGAGKSECALDLVMRGHQLIADDVVHCWRNASGLLLGRGDELIRYHMEIRGLGIINIKDLFGITAVADEHQIHLAIYLEPWNPKSRYQRLGLDFEEMEILNVKIPLIRLPVAPGRNLANLIEVAARNHLLIRKGHSSARNIAQKLDGLLEKKK